MAQAKGMKSTTILGFEDTFGTLQTASAKLFKIPFNKNQLTSKQTLITPATITGTRNPVVPGMGQIAISGNLELPLEARAIGYILKGFFGDPTSTQDETDKTLYHHVFKVGDSEPSMSIEKGFPDISEFYQYGGCKVSKLSFSAEVGNNEATYTADIVGKSETMKSTSLNAAATLIQIARFNNFNASVKQGGTVLGTCTKITADLDGGLETDGYVLDGSAEVYDLPEGIISASGSVTVKFNDASLYSLAVAGTSTSLDLAYTSGKFGLDILFPEVQFERQAPEITGSKGITADFSYQGFHDSDASNSVAVVTLTNDIASY